MTHEEINAAFIAALEEAEALVERFTITETNRTYEMRVALYYACDYRTHVKDAHYWADRNIYDCRVYLQDAAYVWAQLPSDEVEALGLDHVPFERLYAHFRSVAR
jgi:hypothetical protein